MKRITSEQSRFYVPLDVENDKYALQRAKGFTVTPTEDGWESVTYFGEAIQTQPVALDDLNGCTFW